MRKLYRIGALVAVILFSIGTALGTGTQEASAASGFQYCAYFASGNVSCLNAWGGGPLVNVYTSGPTGTANNYFQIRYESNGNIELQFSGGGQWNGYCIGDSYNDSTNASAMLDNCGDLSGNGAGWGTQMQLQQWGPGGPCPVGDYAFFDWHWHGYLGPPAPFSNGSRFYLNKPQNNPICFAQQ
jgi:hypothetical protein